jgi:hypothetical protein
VFLSPKIVVVVSMSLRNGLGMFSGFLLHLQRDHDQRASFSASSPITFPTPSFEQFPESNGIQTKNLWSKRSENAHPHAIGFWEFEKYYPISTNSLAGAVPEQ